MKQSLQLKLGQTLTMTPQLQQAIRLLQLSSMELEMEIQQVLDSNMMLELDEDEAQTFDYTAEAPNLPGTDDGAGYEGEAAEAGGESVEDYVAPSTTDDIPEELPVDSDWDEVFDNTLSASGPGSSTNSPGTAMGGLYDIPAVFMDVRGAFTNTVPIDAYRGAGQQWRRRLGRIREHPRQRRFAA